MGKKPEASGTVDDSTGSSVYRLASGSDQDIDDSETYGECAQRQLRMWRRAAHMNSSLYESREKELATKEWLVSQYVPGGIAALRSAEDWWHEAMFHFGNDSDDKDDHKGSDDDDDDDEDGVDNAHTDESDSSDSDFLHTLPPESLRRAALCAYKAIQTHQCQGSLWPRLAFSDTNLEDALPIQIALQAEAFERGVLVEKDFDIAVEELGIAAGAPTTPPPPDGPLDLDAFPAEPPVGRSTMRILNLILRVCSEEMPAFIAIERNDEQEHVVLYAMRFCRAGKVGLLEVHDVHHTRAEFQDAGSMARLRFDILREKHGSERHKLVVTPGEFADLRALLEQHRGEVACACRLNRKRAFETEEREVRVPLDACGFTFLRFYGDDFFVGLKRKEAGNTAFRTGQFEKARQLYVEAALLVSEDLSEATKVHANLAECCLRLSLYTEAEQAATSALTADPANVKAYFRRAKARFEMNRLAEARQDLEALLRVDPLHAEATVLLCDKFPDVPLKHDKTAEQGFVRKSRHVDGRRQKSASSQQAALDRNAVERKTNHSEEEDLMQAGHITKSLAVIEEASRWLDDRKRISTSEWVDSLGVLLSSQSHDASLLMQAAVVIPELPGAAEDITDDPFRCGVCREDGQPSESTLENMRLISAYLRRAEEAHRALCSMDFEDFAGRWLTLVPKARKRATAYGLAEARNMRRHLLPGADEVAFAPYCKPSSKHDVEMQISAICASFWLELCPSHLVANDHLLQLYRREVAATEDQHVQFAKYCILDEGTAIGEPDLHRLAQIRGGDRRFALCSFLRTVIELVCHGQGLCFGCVAICPEGQLKNCSGCMVESYCSLHCQKRRWTDRHKRLCEELTCAMNFSNWDACFLPRIAKLAKPMKAMLGSACGLRHINVDGLYEEQLERELRTLERTRL